MISPGMVDTVDIDARAASIGNGFEDVYMLSIFFDRVNLGYPTTQEVEHVWNE